MAYVRKLRASKLLKALLSPVTTFPKGLSVRDRGRFRIEDALDVRRETAFTDEIESVQYGDGRVEPLGDLFYGGNRGGRRVGIVDRKKILRKGIIGYASFVQRIEPLLHQPRSGYINKRDSGAQDALTGPLHGTAERSECTSVFTTILILDRKG
jgi:hypothetical protein